MNIARKTSTPDDRVAGKIKIASLNTEPTLGELVAADIRKAEVFKRYGLDFCCGGKQSLKQACAEKNLDVSAVEEALLEASQGSRKASFDFNRWRPEFLADYIYNEHHQYWYDEEPVILELVEKVAARHGARHPELQEILRQFGVLRLELNTHFLKEEEVLFPHIQQLAKATQTNGAPDMRFTNIDLPLQMMETEHEAAGQLLLDMRQLTNDYTAPADACNTFRLMYHKLQSLEEDLHQHIHLENNILFPKAKAFHDTLFKRSAMAAHPPIKRDKSLVSLSRDHHDGLLLTWKIRQGIRLGIGRARIVDYLVAVFDQELAPHFLKEENLLFHKLPADDSYRKMAEDQHAAIRSGIAAFRSKAGQIKNDLPDFASLLERHIRFEERKLFPHLERSLPRETLNAIGKTLDEEHASKTCVAWPDEFWIPAGPAAVNAGPGFL